MRLHTVMMFIAQTFADKREPLATTPPRHADFCRCARTELCPAWGSSAPIVRHTPKEFTR